MMSLVLASVSPRRRELLGLLGVGFDVVPAEVDERVFASPAFAKAEKAARPGAVTIAADTEIDLGGERIGKPVDAGDAKRILRRLAGRDHDVVTEVVTVNAAGRRLRFSVRSTVTMAPRHDAAIDAYVATGEPLDKAGAYAIQGGGRVLVARQDGCLANVVGLPLCHVAGALRHAGLALRARAPEVCQRHFDFTCPVWRTAMAQGRMLREGESYPTATAGGLGGKS